MVVGRGHYNTRSSVREPQHLESGESLPWRDCFSSLDVLGGDSSLVVSQETKKQDEDEISGSTVVGSDAGLGAAASGTGPVGTCI